MTAAILFSRKISLTKQLLALNSDKPQTWIKKTMALLQTDLFPPTYWNLRLSMSSKPGKKTISLLGSKRTAAILSNVIIPFLAAVGETNVTRDELLRFLSPEEDNSIVRQTAHSILGPDHNPSLYRTGLRQQGLIQIFHDFCLNDRSGCQLCHMPDLLNQFEN